MPRRSLPALLLSQEISMMMMYKKFRVLLELLIHQLAYRTF
jgi:hypothetical protein